MDIKTAKETWLLLEKKGAKATDPHLFALDLASSFMAQFFADSEPELEYINILCRMAGSDNPRISTAAVSTIYKKVIEVLCDDFTPSGAELCATILIKLICFVRKNKSGKPIATLLARLGYHDQEDLLKRYLQLCDKPPLDPAGPRKVKKIFILSRVTVGADVAITGIILQRLAACFPKALFVMIGPHHLPEIFSGMAEIKFINLECLRQGHLVDRLQYWPHLYDLIAEESKELAADEVLLFDPDSRLSQLGLLPLLRVDQTFLFNSRSMRPENNRSSLTALTNIWLNRILAENKFVLPKVSYAKHHREMAWTFCQKLRQNGCNRLITINLGVGDNLHKRIPDPFEQKILTALLAEKNTIILLDMGVSSEEKTRVENLINLLKNLSIDTDFVNEKNFASQNIDFAHGIIALQDSIGGFGAMINSSDCFFGYDSCCQHLANANQIPSVIMFTGHPNLRFIERWSPENISGSTRIIPIEKDGFKPEMIDQLVKTTITTLHNLTGS
ncbi:MAG: hypothetical protein KKB30_15815 [Proteobacteria bacterium]|nr:hypothetical protein [Pseudomonadota bacterium]MBU1714489.1 hypothetical protein [Pseudomonadota bacterium]